MKEKFDLFVRPRPSKMLFLLFLIAISLLLLVISPSTQILAQQQNGWQATYWENTNLSGQPVLQIFETDENHSPFLDRNWGTGSPWPAVQTDFFSARWVRTIDMQAGRYVFNANSDDGIRLYVNGELLINEWQNQVVRGAFGSIDLPNGPATITVEYYDYQHEALAQVTWQKVSGSGQALGLGNDNPTITAWRGEYFNNVALAGPPNYVRDDAEIDFDWELESPVPAAINANDFSVRWTRTIELEPGQYRFYATTDDGVRLYLNDSLYIDQWRNQAGYTHEALLNHTGGSVTIRMEYYDALGAASAKLTWSREGAAVPEGPPPAPVAGFRTEFYNNTVLATEPVAVSVEPFIDFDWDTGKYPVPQYMSRDTYSIRFTAVADLPAGEYRFTVLTDDGMRLWVDNQLVLDKWRKQPETVYDHVVTLDGGRIPLQLEYQNLFGDGRIRLQWERVDGQPLPANNGLVVTGAPAVAAPSGNGTASDTTENDAETSDIRFVTVQVSAPQARNAPNMLADTVIQLVRGQELEAIARSPFDNWIQVLLPDGREAWVSILDIRQDFPTRELPLAIEREEEPLPMIEELDGEPIVLVTGRGSKVRTTPSLLSEELDSVSRNTALRALGRDEFAVYIQVELEDGSAGWMSVLYLEADFDLSSLPVIGQEDQE